MERVGNYTLGEKLGRGASASVFAAFDENSGERVTAKIFHPALRSDAHFSKRVQREVKLQSTLNDRRIVKVLDFLETKDQEALIMQFVDGENLGSFQKRLPYVLPEVSAFIIVEILKALEYAHGRGVIHRDIKPENVLVDKQGQVFLTDFGLALEMDGTRITNSHALLGSIDYMSPEQVKGDELTVASDLFSVGSVFYFLVTGTMPFHAGNAIATLETIRKAPVEPPHKRNPKISVGLSKIILKSLEKSPSHRYPSARDFRAALENYLGMMGLSDPAFMSQWILDPSDFTIDCLKVASSSLVRVCESALSERRWDDFIEHFAHLTLKSPQSPALERLMEGYESRNRRKKSIFIAFLISGMLGLAGTGWAIRHFHRKVTLPPAAPKIAPPVEKPLPVEQPVAVKPPPPAVLPVKPKTPTGTVVFHTMEGVAVWWDGRRIDPSKPLPNQRVGSHFVRLEKDGEEPIVSEVIVKKGAPTTINIEN